jgi:hypothetical protein
MPSITLNDATIELTPQENGPYLHLANSLVPALASGQPFAQICCNVIAQGLAEKVPIENALFQCTLWMLWQVGVRSLAIELESGKVTIGQPEKSDLEGRPFEEHFSTGNRATGRALVATLMAISQRTVRVNGEEWRVVPQPLETMKRVNQEVLQSRKFGEDLHVTALRRLLHEILQGKAKDSPEVLAALQVVADLNVRSFSFSPDGKQVSMEAFNEINALVMAYLHNMPPEQAQGLVDRVRALNERCRTGGAPGPGTTAPGPQVNRRRRQD